MPEKTQPNWEVTQSLQFILTADEIGPDLNHLSLLYETIYLVKSGQAKSVIESFNLSCQNGKIIHLRFYDPHGQLTIVPLIKVEYLPTESIQQELLGGFPADVIRVSVTLTQAQLWALDADTTDLSFGY